MRGKRRQRDAPVTVCVLTIKSTPRPSLLPSQQDLEDSLNEIRILASFKHPRLIRWYETFVESDLQELCIVMELCPYGDLEQKIKRHQHRKEYIDERYVCFSMCV
jgi:serine/threonine protein kinase